MAAYVTVYVGKRLGRAIAGCRLRPINVRLQCRTPASAALARGALGSLLQYIQNFIGHPDSLVFRLALNKRQVQSCSA